MMEPHIFIIFGASGDLTTRKLIPAFFHLFQSKVLPEHFAILGVSRTNLSDQEFRNKAVLNNEHIDTSESTYDDLDRFAQLMHYQAIDTSDGASYALVKSRLELLDDKLQTQGNYIFYLSTPPKLYFSIPEYLSLHGLNQSATAFRRLIIEKPFGYNLHSAIELNDHLLTFFPEDQIYRIDHYLGKETVQNLLVTRFANGIFEPLWNRNYIQHVQITSAEDIGVKNRGGYYDESGAMRDMIQNHLLQIVAHIAMEPPFSADAQSIRNEKLKLFRSLRPITTIDEINKHVIRGQYTESSIDNKTVPSYRNEKDVAPESKTETYVAMKFFIDNWRWADVPFYMRTGKRMPTKVTEIVITFKPSPHSLFNSDETFSSPHNQLIIRIQPHEGVALKFGLKVPGQGFRVKNANMDFHYADMANTKVIDAYERLILDSIKGDATLYTLGESVEAAWKFVDPIIENWKNNHSKLYGYPAGSWGPKEANFLFPEGTNWRNPCKSLTKDNSFCEL